MGTTTQSEGRRAWRLRCRGACNGSGWCATYNTRGHIAFAAWHMVHHMALPGHQETSSILPSIGRLSPVVQHTKLQAMGHTWGWGICKKPEQKGECEQDSRNGVLFHTPTPQMPHIPAENKKGGEGRRGMPSGEMEADSEPEMGHEQGAAQLPNAAIGAKKGSGGMRV